MIEERVGKDTHYAMLKGQNNFFLYSKNKKDKMIKKYFPISQKWQGLEFFHYT